MAGERAQEWIATPKINPLISYYSTSELATIVAQTTNNSSVDTWLVQSQNRCANWFRCVMPLCTTGRLALPLDRLQHLREMIYTAVSESTFAEK